MMTVTKRTAAMAITILTMIPQVFGQTKAGINSVTEKTFSAAGALGWKETAAHNAGSFLLWDIPTYSELSATYQMRREEDAELPQEGDGLDNGSVKVSSLVRLQGGSAVKAGAEYSRGVKRNVLWNSTSDFRLLYPDVMVDTVGGNLQTEQYSFHGAWSKMLGKAHIGVYGGYRALHEYRMVDPRPRAVTSDLNAALAGGIAAGGYVIDLGGALRIYKQSQDVSFYDPLGANTSEMHFTGLGSHFARFDGAGDFTSARYVGHGWEASATLTPVRRNGWMAIMSYNSLDIDRRLVSNNEVPITALWVQKLSGAFGYRHLDGAIRWSVLAEARYELRQSTENIIDTGKNKEYAVLGSLTMYRNRIFTAGVKGVLEIPSRAGTFSAAPVIEYYRSAAAYIFPEREMSFGLADTGLKIGMRRHFKEWLLSAGAEFHRGTPTGGSLSIPADHTETRILEYLEHFHGMMSAGRTLAGLSLGIQREIGKSTAAFLRPEFTFRSIDGFGNAVFLTTAAGLAF